MKKQDDLVKQLNSQFADALLSIDIEHDEITVVCGVDTLISVLKQLRDQKEFTFDQMIDLCVVDYLLYGEYDWETDLATEKGFSRAVEFDESRAYSRPTQRFAVVYHLLSTQLNHRLRLKVFVEESNLVLPSAHEIWKSVNWFEREAYDLYGVLFEGHPDLRRILTDYGFIGHPFRKDFPISGHVEMRYDAFLKKVIYEPVDIVPRVLVPKVIRNDNRYLDLAGAKNG